MARLGAGVRKREDGTLEKRFTVKGKRFSVYAKTTKELVEKEQEMRNFIDEGLYKDNRNITLDKYFEEWSKQRLKQTKENTIYTYNRIYKTHIKPFMGGRKVQEIERRECVALQDILSKKELSTSTVNYILTLLKTILNSAVVDEIINRNPANGIKPIKGDETPTRETIHRALTEDEQKDFMLEAKGNFYYELMAFLLTTGMRIGEAGALTWKDIDYKSNTIHVTKTLTLGIDGKRKVDTPKSKAGVRDIPMTDTIKDILKEQRAKAMSLSNVISFENHVFFTSYGKKLSACIINREIKNVLTSAEEKGKHIDYFSVHAFRDTFATRFIEQGGTPQTLKTILGHSTLAMTMDLYAHVLPNKKQDEMSRIKIII